MENNQLAVYDGRKMPSLFVDPLRIVNSKGVYPNIGDAETGFGDAISLIKDPNVVQEFLKGGLQDLGQDVWELMDISDWRVQMQPEPEGPGNILDQYTDEQLEVLQSIALKNFTYELDTPSAVNFLQLVDLSTKNKDATKYGTACGRTARCGNSLPLWASPRIRR